jgi:hypothetical protein
MAEISTYDKTMREFLFSRNLGTYWGYNNTQEFIEEIHDDYGLYNHPFYKEFGEAIYGKEKYTSYIDFFNKVYGQVTPPIQFVEGLIGTQFLDETIKNDSPAVVYPEPKVSMAGFVKTNINNYSGVDTRLGLLSNQIYGYKMYVASNFNTLRKETSSYNQSFITPSASKRFGNTQANVNSLTTITAPLRGDGRIIEDYNSEVKIIHNREQLHATKTMEVPRGLKDRMNEKKTRNENGENIDIQWYNGNVTTRNVQIRDTYPNLEEVVSDVDLNITLLKQTLNNIQTWEELGGKKFSIEDGSFYGVNGTQFNERIVIKPIPTKTPGSIQHCVYSDGDKNAKYISELNNDVYEGVDLSMFAGALDMDYKGDYKRILSEQSLIMKTHKLFKNNEINNLGFGEFVDTHFKPKDITTSDTSTSKEGRSRGRNLLKLKSQRNVDENGRYNPFCRTWTYQHQYDTFNKTIRPISDDGEIMTHEKTQNLNKHRRSFNQKMGDSGIENGAKYLADNSVLDNETTLVNIAPSKLDKIDIKKCMFSIENLAWKDVLNKEEYLSKEQRGPNGGRIMWFPPYDLNFNESTSVNWESNSFIGRGEKIYTYSDTDRTGTLSFTLLVDNPAMLQNIYNEYGQRETNPDTNGLFDDKDLLRFFAGEVLLKTKRTEEEIVTKDVEYWEEEWKEMYDMVEEVQFKKDVVETNAYFPFNYSGVKTEVLKYKKSYDKVDEKFIKSDKENGSYHEYRFTGEESNETIPLTFKVNEENKALPIINKNNTCQTNFLSYLIKGYSIGTFENTEFNILSNAVNSDTIYPNIGYEMIYNENELNFKQEESGTTIPPKYFVLVIDNSGSMGSRDTYTNINNETVTDTLTKYTIDTLRQFVNCRNIPGELYSLVFFATSGATYMEKIKNNKKKDRNFKCISCLTSTEMEEYKYCFNKDEITEILQYINDNIDKLNEYKNKIKIGALRKASGGGTNYYTGLGEAKFLTSASTRPENIQPICIFLSDGQNYGKDPITIANTIKTDNTCEIYSVGYKIQKGTSTEKLLLDISSGDGYLFLPSQEKTLASCFTDISQLTASASYFNKLNGNYTVSSTFIEYRKADEIFTPIGRTCDTCDSVEVGNTDNNPTKKNEYIEETITGDYGYFRTINYITNDKTNGDKYEYLVDSDAIGNNNIIYEISKQSQLNLKAEETTTKADYTPLIGDFTEEEIESFQGSKKNYAFCKFIYCLLRVYLLKTVNKLNDNTKYNKFLTIEYTDETVLEQSVPIEPILKRGDFSEKFGQECFDIVYHIEKYVNDFEEGLIYDENLIKVFSTYFNTMTFEIEPYQNPDEKEGMGDRRGESVSKFIKRLLGLDENTENRRVVVKPQAIMRGNIKGISDKKGAQRVIIRVYYNVDTVTYLTESDKPTRYKDYVKKHKLEIDIIKKDIKPTYKRYETEAEYFTKLKDTNPLLHKRLVDKFKYFDPAFHSMSPEGFNARLTFLHQCTRQGNTLEMRKRADGLQQDTEGHMSFGRMPVCVLRIGDFINTKILINSIQIRHGKDSMQWDLNPESIGVQPMMATVSMSITIIGGQSLESPINHLQNAVSFNYYANAGVYDDRAFRARPTEEAGKNVEGSTVWGTEHYYTWLPVHENKNNTNK